MLKNTRAQILGNNPTNIVVKTIDCDMQEPDSQSDFIIKIEEFEFTITKILMIDYIEPLINIQGYIKINGLIYKVLKIKTPDENNMEVYLYELERQVI